MWILIKFELILDLFWIILNLFESSLNLNRFISSLPLGESVDFDQFWIKVLGILVRYLKKSQSKTETKEKRNKHWEGNVSLDFTIPCWESKPSGLYDIHASICGIMTWHTACLSIVAVGHLYQQNEISDIMHACIS